MLTERFPACNDNKTWILAVIFGTGFKKLAYRYCCSLGGVIRIALRALQVATCESDEDCGCPAEWAFALDCLEDAMNFNKSVPIWNELFYLLGIHVPITV